MHKIVAVGVPSDRSSRTPLRCGVASPGCVSRRCLRPSLLLCVAPALLASFAAAQLPSAPEPHIATPIAFHAASSAPAVDDRRLAGPVEGHVADPDGALIPRATVLFTSGHHHLQTQTDAAGHFTMADLTPGTWSVTASAADFDSSTKDFTVVERTAARLPERRQLDFKLPLHQIEQQVSVDGGGAASSPIESGSGTQVLGKHDLAGLADDPDQLLSQLQMFSASTGASPDSATVSLDGFLGGTTLPSKWAISSVTINPDLYSAQYNQAPYEGGRIEVHTQAGTQSFHGSLFASGNPSFANAADPFAPTRSPSSTQRYGMQFGGPILRNKLDFFASIDHRAINEYSVVAADVLNAQGVETPFNANVARPEQLWIGGLQLDAQLTPATSLTARYDTNRNSTDGMGIGGLNLPESGYNSRLFTQAVHLSLDTVLHGSLLNQTRAAMTWTQLDRDALSTAPSILVPGSFQGGGAPLQHLAQNSRDLELDNYLSWSSGPHQLKAGLQLFHHTVVADTLENFNGSYLFGGSVAPGAGSLTGLEQYRLALQGSPGGAATYFQRTAGSPFVSAAQWSYAAFMQDHVNLRRNLSASLGLRYEGQSAPRNLGSWAPRLGLALAAGKNNSWLFHLRFGLFYDPAPIGVLFDSRRLNGVTRTQQTAYGATLGNPLAGNPDVFASTLGYAAHPAVPRTEEAQFGIEHAFPGNWHAQANAYWVQGSNFLRSINRNAPLVTSAYLNDPWDAPRPLGTRENIVDFTPNGSVSGPFFVGLLQQTSKSRYHLVLGDVYMDTRTDADTPYTSPQSTYSNAGEWARPLGKPVNTFFVFSTLSLPWKLDYTTTFRVESGRPYNVISGYDNNGDGIADDRPSLLSASSGCLGNYATSFGCLDANTLDGTLPRNRGVLPATLSLDGNLRRSFALNKSDSRSLTVNLRGTNLLNHTDVTGVDNVLLSPTFTQPYAAKPGRRVELGIHFDF